MKTTAKIESYLDGSMGPAEKEAFESQLSTDPALAEMVKLHEEVNTAIKENEVHYFRECVRSIVRRHSAGSKNLKLSWLKIPMVAGILVLIGLSIWQLSNTHTPKELYNRHYAPYDADMATRDVSKPELKGLYLAFRLYEEGDHEASYEILNNYLDQHTDPTAEFYRGMNAIELGYKEIAIESLSDVEQNPASPFALHARWYLAMIYLRNDNPEKASKYLTVLSQNENLYRERAIAILDDI